jgi:hypothetical protein
MVGGLSMGGLSRGSGPGREKPVEEPRLRGVDTHLEEGMDLEDLKRLLRDQEYACHGCKALLPEPEFDLEIEGSRVYPEGPALLGIEEGGDHGFMDRRGRWFCLACAVNHPNGAVVRKIALKNDWGYLLAWDSGGLRLGWKDLAVEMHRAAEEGAVSAMTRILVGGYKAGDIWTLAEPDRNLLARNPRLRGFPLRRPAPLQERVLWSGTMLADGIDHTTVHRLLEDQKVFVLLTSAALGLKKQLLGRPVEPPAASASSTPTPRVEAVSGGQHAPVAPAAVVPPEDPGRQQLSEAASAALEGVDAFSFMSAPLAAEPLEEPVAEVPAAPVAEVAAKPKAQPGAKGGEATQAADSVVVEEPVAVVEAPVEASAAASPAPAKPTQAADGATPGEEILGLAGPPPGVEGEDEVSEEEPPD